MGSLFHVSEIVWSLPQRRRWLIYKVSTSCPFTRNEGGEIERGIWGKRGRILKRDICHVFARLETIYEGDEAGKLACAAPGGWWGWGEVNAAAEANSSYLISGNCSLGQVKEEIIRAQCGNTGILAGEWGYRAGRRVRNKRNEWHV